MCVTFCDGTNRTTTTPKSTVACHTYATTTIGDVIAGAALATGWYAYTASSSDTATGPFRMMEIGANNEITNIQQCSGAFCVAP